MSIICGALRWLKDYNKRIRERLFEKINKLEVEKQNCSTEVVDWLNTKAREIELTRMIYELKMEINRIEEYDAKLEKIKKAERKKKRFNFKDVLLKDELEQEIADEEDELTLDDPVLNLDEESEEDEDSDKKYEPIKVKLSPNSIHSCFL